MWLTSFLPKPLGHAETQSFLDLCLHISPDVFTDNTGTIACIHLSSVAHYWRLEELIQQSNNHKHPLVHHLKLLSHSHPFVFSPSPSIGAWALKIKNYSSEIFNIYNSLEIQKQFQKLSPQSLETLIGDLLGKKEEAHKNWHLFIKDMNYLGINNILDLKSLFREPSLRQHCFDRFPDIAPLLYKRLIMGTQDFSLKAYQAPRKISSEFYPEQKTYIPEKIEEVLRAWQLRLEARKSYIKGVELRLSTKNAFNEIDEHPIEINFSNLLQSAKEISEQIDLRISQLDSYEKEIFSKAIHKIELQSLGLEKTSSHQISLFEQTHEQKLSHWKKLLNKKQKNSGETTNENNSDENAKPIIQKQFGRAFLPSQTTEPAFLHFQNIFLHQKDGSPEHSLKKFLNRASACSILEAG